MPTKGDFYFRLYLKSITSYRHVRPSELAEAKIEPVLVDANCYPMSEPITPPLDPIYSYNGQNHIFDKKLTNSFVVEDIIRDKILESRAGWDATVIVVMIKYMTILQ